MLILTGPKLAVRQVSLSGCGQWVATFRGQYDADLYDRHTGKRAYRVDDFAAHGCAVHPSGDLFLAWGGDGFLTVDTGDLVAEPKTADPVEYTATVAALPDGRLVGVGLAGRDEGFIGWELAGGVPRRTWQVARDGFLNGPFVLAPGGVWFAAQNVPPADSYVSRVEVRATTDGKLRTIGSPYGTLVGLLDTGRPVMEARGRLAVANLALLTPYQPNDAARPLAGRGAVAAAVSPDGAMVLAARDKSVYMLAADTLAVRRAYTWPTAGKPTCVAFAPDGLTAACGTSKGEVVIWDVD